MTKQGSGESTWWTTVTLEEGSGTPTEVTAGRKEGTSYIFWKQDHWYHYVRVKTMTEATGPLQQCRIFEWMRMSVGETDSSRKWKLLICVCSSVTVEMSIKHIYIKCVQLGSEKVHSFHSGPFKQQRDKNPQDQDIGKFTFMSKAISKSQVK